MTLNLGVKSRTLRSVDVRSDGHSLGVARNLRLEYAEAVYHVISRGNYRADVFAQEATKVAFLKCLGEACWKGGVDRACVVRDVQPLPSLPGNAAAKPGRGHALAAGDVCTAVQPVSQ